MARYIDADILREKFVQGIRVFCGKCTVENIMRNIDGMPTADVEKVRHAYWVKHDCDKFNPIYKCSECGRILMGYSNPDKVPYCHCGAKMDKGRENELL